MAAVAIGAAVAAAVGVPLAVYGGHSADPPAWTASCFQTWDKHQPVDAKPDSRPDGMSSASVTEFAASHRLGLAAVARDGRCVGGWGYTASQAHLPAYLYVAFDRTGHVAAAWYAPARGNVVSAR